MLEIVIAMGILALISAGIFGAVIFSRKISWRSESELRIAEFTQRITEQMRSVAAIPGEGSNPQNLSLKAGIYVNRQYPDADPTTDGIQLQQRENPLGRKVTPIAALDPPSSNDMGVPLVPPWTRFNVRVRCYVEDHLTDADGDGEARGINLNHGTGVGQDNDVDLRWVRVVVDWDSPQP